MAGKAGAETVAIRFCLDTLGGFAATLCGSVREKVFASPVLCLPGGVYRADTLGFNGDLP